MADSTYWFTYLNTPNDTDVNDFIIQQFKLLHEEYVVMLVSSLVVIHTLYIAFAQTLLSRALSQRFVSPFP